MKSVSLNTHPAWTISLFGLSVVFVALASIIMGQSLLVGVMTGLGGVFGVVLTFYFVNLPY